MQETLHALGLDVVLTSEAPQCAQAALFITRKIAALRVKMYVAPDRSWCQTLPKLLHHERLILLTGAIRIGFDSLITRLGITSNIGAEFDDMAILRLLARGDAGVALTPDVVLADEIATGRKATAPFDLELTETITAPRNFPNRLLAELLNNSVPCLG